jgi:dihydrofolate reductase
MKANSESRVTIHMAASLDGFIARKDGRVDWLETSDEFAGGETLDPESVETFLKTIDCYVMGSRTYETALNFEAKGFGWAYGDKPTFVLTSRELARSRDTVKFHSGDLVQFVGLAFPNQGLSVWHSIGEAAFQEVPHLHIHIHPRLTGDNLLYVTRRSCVRTFE